MTPPESESSSSSGGGGGGGKEDDDLFAVQQPAKTDDGGDFGDSQPVVWGFEGVSFAATNEKDADFGQSVFSKDANFDSESMTSSITTGFTNVLAEKSAYGDESEPDLGDDDPAGDGRPRSDSARSVDADAGSGSSAFARQASDGGGVSLDGETGDGTFDFAADFGEATVPPPLSLASDDIRYYREKKFAAATDMPGGGGTVDQTPVEFGEPTTTGAAGDEPARRLAVSFGASVELAAIAEEPRPAEQHFAESHVDADEQQPDDDDDNFESPPMQEVPSEEQLQRPATSSNCAGYVQVEASRAAAARISGGFGRVEQPPDDPFGDLAEDPDQAVGGESSSKPSSDWGNDFGENERAAEPRTDDGFFGGGGDFAEVSTKERNLAQLNYGELGDYSGEGKQPSAAEESRTYGDDDGFGGFGDEPTREAAGEQQPSRRIPEEAAFADFGDFGSAEQQQDAFGAGAEDPNRGDPSSELGQPDSSFGDFGAVAESPSEVTFGDVADEPEQHPEKSSSSSKPSATTSGFIEPTGEPPVARDDLADESIAPAVGEPSSEQAADADFGDFGDFSEQPPLDSFRDFAEERLPKDATDNNLVESDASFGDFGGGGGGGGVERVDAFGDLVDEEVAAGEPSSKPPTEEEEEEEDLDEFGKAEPAAQPPANDDGFGGDLEEPRRAFGELSRMKTAELDDFPASEAPAHDNAFGGAKRRHGKLAADAADLDDDDDDDDFGRVDYRAAGGEESPADDDGFGDFSQEPEETMGNLSGKPAADFGADFGDFGDFSEQPPVDDVGRGGFSEKPTEVSGRGERKPASDADFGDFGGVEPRIVDPSDDFGDFSTVEPAADLFREAAGGERETPDFGGKTATAEASPGPAAASEFGADFGEADQPDVGKTGTSAEFGDFDGAPAEQLSAAAANDDDDDFGDFDDAPAADFGDLETSTKGDSFADFDQPSEEEPSGQTRDEDGFGDFENPSSRVAGVATEDILKEVLADDLEVYERARAEFRTAFGFVASETPPSAKNDEYLTTVCDERLSLLLAATGAAAYAHQNPSLELSTAVLDALKLSPAKEEEADRQRPARDLSAAAAAPRLDRADTRPSSPSDALAEPQPPPAAAVPINDLSAFLSESSAGVQVADDDFAASAVAAATAAAAASPDDATWDFLDAISSAEAPARTASSRSEAAMLGLSRESSSPVFDGVSRDLSPPPMLDGISDKLSDGKGLNLENQILASLGVNNLASGGGLSGSQTTTAAAASPSNSRAKLEIKAKLNSLIDSLPDYSFLLSKALVLPLQVSDSTGRSTDDFWS